MSRKFKMKPELFFVCLPGIGKIRKTDILEGERYAKYCPKFLVEIFEKPVNRRAIKTKEQLEIKIPILKVEEKPVEISEEIELDLDKDIIILPDADGKEPGLVIGKKKGGRPKKIIIEE